MIKNLHHESANPYSELFLIFLFILVIGYLAATIYLYYQKKKWSIIKFYCWVFGIVCIALAVVGPIASQAHHHFMFHMIGHILVGMLGPFLLVLSAPISLLLKILPVKYARKVAAILKCWPFKILSDPIVTTILNVGGLWLLYSTDLFLLMHENVIVANLIHLHMFLAGYAFTFSILCIDPTAHKKSFIYRATILILALAAHGILSKLIYVHPPLGVSRNDAEIGAMVMYYGGDLIDFGIIYVLCLQWYHVRGRKLDIHKKTAYSLKG
ncbi:cytochrome c oxidase assembly protein [Bacillus sp. J37]|uniref:cytochrome c oxidase assembly protein n=1 Tax=Bacillus sp. J37 TaxID=935837 RepID=UPI0004B4627A|nr:cytochrome c oxidase assembly protein [Bacillus sp. J37]